MPGKADQGGCAIFLFFLWLFWTRLLIQKIVFAKSKTQKNQPLGSRLRRNGDFFSISLVHQLDMVCKRLICLLL